MQKACLSAGYMWNKLSLGYSIELRQFELLFDAVVFGTSTFRWVLKILQDWILTSLSCIGPRLNDAYCVSSSTIYAHFTYCLVLLLKRQKLCQMVTEMSLSFQIIVERKVLVLPLLKRVDFSKLEWWRLMHLRRGTWHLQSQHWLISSQNSLQNRLKFNSSIFYYYSFSN